MSKKTAESFFKFIAVFLIAGIILGIKTDNHRLFEVYAIAVSLLAFAALVSSLLYYRYQKYYNKTID